MYIVCVCTCYCLFCLVCKNISSSVYSLYSTAICLNIIPGLGLTTISDISSVTTQLLFTIWHVSNINLRIITKYGIIDLIVLATPLSHASLCNGWLLTDHMLTDHIDR